MLRWHQAWVSPGAVISPVTGHRAPRYPQDLAELISRVTFCSHGHFAFSRTDGRPALDAALGFARENISLGLERAERVNW